MSYFVSILTTAILFCALILLLASKPMHSKKITVAALTIAGVFGLVIYGYGYMAVTKNLPLAVLKALLAVCSSFVGGNEYSSIAAAPLMQSVWMQILCNFIRLCALYVTTSAVVTAISAEALKKFRLWVARRGKLNLIFGVTKDSVDFGKELLQTKNGSVVFIAEEVDSAKSAAIAKAGCVLRSDDHALEADVKFLKSIGFRRKNRAVTLYALDPNPAENLKYALKILHSLEEKEADPKFLRLVIQGQEETAVNQLQASSEKYGFGFVTVVNEPQMTARLLTMEYPPCKTISFDKNGKATEDFEMLLVGFGQVGQAVLKSLIMNGQFAGSRFRAAVFSPDCKAEDGNFSHRFRQIFKEYDVTFYEHDARSNQMYDYLETHGTTLKYVAVCTGSKKLNREIAEDLTAYLLNLGLTVPVYQCSRGGVEFCHPNGAAVTHKIYRCNLLCTHNLDAMAMIVNHRYQSSSEKTALEHWMECDYFNRQSNRATADFVPSFLYAVGKSKKEVLEGDWKLSKKQLENLAITEHLRWCAFHFCMGFSPMTQKEMQKRGKAYRKQLEKGEEPSIRVSKNLSGRTHACLVPWEKLEEVAQRESRYTGSVTDYKALDRKNIRIIPELLEEVAKNS